MNKPYSIKETDLLTYTRTVFVESAMYFCSYGDGRMKAYTHFFARIEMEESFFNK